MTSLHAVTSSQVVELSSPESLRVYVPMNLFLSQISREQSRIQKLLASYSETMLVVFCSMKGWGNKLRWILAWKVVAALSSLERVAWPGVNEFFVTMNRAWQAG